MLFFEIHALYSKIMERIENVIRIQYLLSLSFLISVRNLALFATLIPNELLYSRKFTTRKIQLHLFQLPRDGVRSFTKQKSWSHHFACLRAFLVELTEPAVSNYITNYLNAFEIILENELLLKLYNQQSVHLLYTYV